MPSESIREYQIDYSCVTMHDGQGWAAYLTIYVTSSNPMHRSVIFPNQRVCVETVFPNPREAESNARLTALALIG